MKDYIEKAIISILNQSFQNFEIIIVNDHSEDKTQEVIKKLQLKDGRIKLIKFLMLMDPDDMLINPNILEELFKYNLKYNLDLIEFTVISFFEKNKTLSYIEKYYHFHYFFLRR